MCLHRPGCPLLPALMQKQHWSRPVLLREHGPGSPMCREHIAGADYIVYYGRAVQLSAVCLAAPCEVYTALSAAGCFANAKRHRFLRIVGSADLSCPPGPMSSRELARNRREKRLLERNTPHSPESPEGRAATGTWSTHETITETDAFDCLGALPAVGGFCLGCNRETVTTTERPQGER